MYVRNRARRMRTSTAAVLAVLLSACHRGAPPPGAGQAPPPTEVTVVTVTPRDLPLPFEYLGRTLRTEGSLVDTGDQGLLTTLLQLDPIYAAFQRTENQQFAFDRDVHSGRLVLPAGGKLAVDVQYRDGTVLASGGVLDFSDGKLDAATGTIPMRATLPNKDLRLRAGQAVKVVLRGAVLKDALTVPQRAVVEWPQGKAVLVVVDKDDKTVFEARPIEVGDWIDLPGEGALTHGWVVNKGLVPGDRVIVDNLVRLGMMPPGLPVHDVPAATAPAWPAANR